ncbi:Hypothetical predicted protein [Cloeon dipterum]|nr:Hypothetical predicted protein [Cloeon dipterum]
MLESLKKMQSLKTLHIDLYWFKQNELLDMCKNLPNLHNLNVLSHTSGPDPLAPEVFTSSFCNVKQITVNDFWWIADLCNKNLPDVEIVPLFETQFFIWINVLNDIFNEEYFIELRQPCQRHVYVDLATNKIRPMKLRDFPALFPNVSCLSAGLLGEPNEEKSPLLQFDNIRELNLAVDHEDEDLIFRERYLSTYGENLQTLNLSSLRGFGFKMDLAIISKYCPKLEKLSLNYCYLINPTLPIENFIELKEFEWKLPDAGTGYMEDAMILSNVLSAPKLEKVVLEGAHFENTDLMRLNSLIQEKKILSQLHTFHFYLHSDNRAFPDVRNRPGNVIRNMNKKFLKNIFKSACAFLPKLRELRVGRSNDLIEHPLVTSAIRNDDKFFDHCIRSLLYLFENEK